MSNKKTYQDDMIKELPKESIIDYQTAIDIVSKDDSNYIFVMIEDNDDINLFDFGYIGSPEIFIDIAGTVCSAGYCNTMILHEGTIGDKKEILEKAKPYVKCIFI